MEAVELCDNSSIDVSQMIQNREVCRRTRWSFRIFAVILALLILGQTGAESSVQAQSKPKHSKTTPRKQEAICTNGLCYVEAEKKHQRKTNAKNAAFRVRQSKYASRGSDSRRAHSSSEPNFHSDAAAANRHAKQVEAALATYQKRLAAHALCLQGLNSQRCAVPVAPTFAAEPWPFAIGHSLKGPAAPPTIVLTPQEVAYIAFARLKLTAPKPGVGPPPSINRWHMAAVGYPLWLWAQGSTNPAPVSDSVGGLFVSLDARVSKIVFDMGDGSKVTCRNLDKRWGSSVPAGQPSPVCGYTYTQPSLPHGKYTVTATTYWSVAWNVTGHTGVIPFVQTASTKLPVGELQVLVR